MKTTKRRCFACYGAIAAVTIAAAAVLTACEPASWSVAMTDWASLLDTATVPGMP